MSKGSDYILDVRILDIVHWLLFFKVLKKKKSWPEYVENNHKNKVFHKVINKNIAITFINHSTFLIESENINILTDPFFSKRASPFSWLGPKRVRNPGILIEDLPNIDIVLVSHNHYDHMDLPALIALKSAFDPLFITGTGNAQYLLKHRITRVCELDWWKTAHFSEKLDAKLQIVMTPACHFSGRSLFDINRSLCGGFVIKLNEKKIFFAGDTGYNKHFSEIFDRFGEMDISMLPIGAYKTSSAMRSGHMSPDEAVRAHLELKSKMSIGMHFGTLQLSLEEFEEPVQTLHQALTFANIKSGTFRILECGEQLQIAEEKIKDKINETILCDLENVPV